MIAKIRVGNPTYSQNLKGEGFLTFSITSAQNWLAKQICEELENNQKELKISLAYATKKRSLSQNDLLWGLLTEEAKFLAGGRKNGEAQCTAETLYYDAINKYGTDTMLSIKECAVQALKRVYKRVFIIDRFIRDDEVWVNCKCVIGSSNYDIKEMTNLIEGVLDDIAKLGISTQEIRYLREEFNEIRTNKK